MEPEFKGPHNHSETDLRNNAARARLRLVETSEKQIGALNSLGQDLRKARQAKGLEISQVSSALKISKCHLNAIEESNAKVLPMGDVYLIGYTRTYADYLGLNSRKCVEKLKSEIAEREANGRIPMAQIHRPPSAVRHALRFFGLGHYDL